VSKGHPEFELTEVDTALQTAQANPAYANLFFDTFLNAEIFVPALRADKKPGDWVRLNPADRFFPLYLRQGEIRAVPVFDRIEKMKAWADDKAFDYLTLQAYLFLKVVATEVAIVLNEGTELHYFFTPEALETLRTAMKPVSPN
jgi:hypothetical protein